MTLKKTPMNLLFPFLVPLDTSTNPAAFNCCKIFLTITGFVPILPAIHQIIPGVLAAGVPCRVIREITEEDALSCHPELFGV